MGKQGIKKAEKLSSWARIEKMHAHKTMILLSMVGSTLIFLFLITAFSLSFFDGSSFAYIQFPKAFVVSSFLILLSSYFLSKTLAYYNSDNILSLNKALGITLLFGVAFALSQFIGWKELNLAGIYFSGERSGAYLYVISGIHLAHLLGGLIFLGFLFSKTRRASKDPVETLIYLTTPYEKIRLEMISLWWHFMDALWIFLFFWFLFTF
jgi:cytochrome c oxidase subunit 3